MISSRISLDGTWTFRHALDEPSLARAAPREIAVPGPWQAQFADLRMKAGFGLYRRTVTLPAGWIQGCVRLVAGAAFHHASVSVNGVAVGESRGGWLPFAIDVTGVLREGDNEIVILVESPIDDPASHPEAPAAEILGGKQNWYGPQSGLWQPVYLERRDPDYAEGVRIRSDLATGDVAFAVRLGRPAGDGVSCEICIADPQGAVLHRLTADAAFGASEIAVPARIAAVQPWSPDAPNLYSATITVRRAGEPVDRIGESFGFRTFETRDGRFFLNGQPIYLRAALDQDYYPDTLCTTPSTAFLDDQFRKAKELGLNCVRCHIKAADPRYYEAADRLGLLVWTELPNAGRLSPRARARAEALLKGIVDRDGNHPSIVIWTIINENWGTDLVHNAEHRDWLKRSYAWLKAYDPGRLVVDNSPLAPSFHVRTDIADYHFYAAIPDHRADWDRFVDELASRPEWLYSAEGDAVATGQEPLMCSEFGNWGLPLPADLADAQGREPWWFETGHDWGDGIMYAHGVETRFADWSLDRVFGSLDGFVEAAQWQQFRALKYAIEAMRRKPQLAGYVITELTDCHWESNGLLDMRRKKRVFHNAFLTVNAPTVIVPQWERTAYWAGERMRLKIAIAHGEGPALTGAILEARLGGETQTLTVPPVAPGGVADLGAVTLRVPETERPEVMTVQLSLRGAEGRLVNTNHVTLAVHPKRAGPPLGETAVWAPSAHLRDHLAGLGYRIARNLASADLAVAVSPSPALAEYVRRGGRLLLLSDSPQQLYPFFPHWQAVRVLAREGTLWRGDWASSFSWLRRGRTFSALPGGPLLDHSFDRVFPTHVIAGCNLQDFQARVHAGLTIGWIHKPVALAVERGYGDGRFAASTFRLFRDAPLADPTATVLLDRLLVLTAGVITGAPAPAPAA